MEHKVLIDTLGVHSSRRRVKHIRRIRGCEEISTSPVLRTRLDDSVNTQHVTGLQFSHVAPPHWGDSKIAPIQELQENAPPIDGHVRELQANAPSMDGHVQELPENAPQENAPSMDGHVQELPENALPMDGHVQELQENAPPIDGHVRELQENAPPIDGHGSNQTKTAELQSGICEQLPAAASLVGNGYPRAPATKSSRTCKVPYASLKKHTPEARSRGSVPGIYQEIDPQVLLSEDRGLLLSYVIGDSNLKPEIPDDEEHQRGAECREKFCTAPLLISHCASQRHASNTGSDSFADESCSRKRALMCTVTTASSCVSELLAEECLTKTLTSTRDGEGPHACNKRGLSLGESWHTNESMLTLTSKKSYQCAECGHRLALKSTMKEHMLIHTGEKPHCCSVCGQAFARKSTVRTHMFTHTGEKPYICDLCGQRFTQKTTRNRHVLAHMGEKPFECDVCGQRFVLKSNLKTHTRIHTAEKPYACNECGQRFTQKEHMNQHMLTHTGEKPHACDVCGRKFASRSTMRRHTLIHAKSRNIGPTDSTKKVVTKTCNEESHTATGMHDKLKACDHMQSQIV